MISCHNKILEIKNISKSFDDKKVLADINIHLNKGEIISLLGTSGVGKTTLFNIVAGLLSPDFGDVLLEGESIVNQSGKLSYMLQKHLLMPYKTVLDNIALPLIIKGVSKQEARAIANENFATFGLDGYQDKYPHEMSGGMCQRAALLRTYLFSDNVALLDEPFSALDTITKGNLQTWYLEIMEKIKLSTIFITHDIDEAIYLSDRVYILAGSPARIVEEIIVEEKKPRTQEFLLTSGFLSYKRRVKEAIDKNYTI